MIGKTISKFRSDTSIAKNKDVGPKAMVWTIAFLLCTFHSNASFSQTSSSIKANGKTVNEAAVKPKATEGPAAAKENSKDENDGDIEGDEQVENEATAAAPELEAEAVASDDNSEPKTENKIENKNVKKDESTVELEIPHATESEYVEVIPREKNVEIVSIKKYGSYRERRTTSGLLVNINAENLYFSEYKSILDGALYEKLFGQEDLAMVQLQVGYKFNFVLGSVVSGASYGSGTLIDDRSTEERSLTLNKKSAYAQWLFDSLMKEPYLVPYFGINYWTMSIHEQNNTAAPTAGKITSLNHDTGNGTAITVGFLVQLNWLEPETSKLAYLNNGLENTYLDVFWTEYRGTDHALDPNLENGFNFGAGLRLEF